MVKLLSKCAVGTVRVVRIVLVIAAPRLRAALRPRGSSAVAARRRVGAGPASARAAGASRIRTRPATRS
ncbi:hypothetical protein WI69_19500 [Burkholderia diffusa]|nr:hypothetical protein WI69_19500 [Burkholderia diffusa]